LYLYPVIGQCVTCRDPSACTQPVDSCPTGTAPLILQFSGPDMIVQEDVDAANLEWYQPVHEVGNVFSYPATETQLGSLFPPDHQPDKLAQSDVFFTDTSGTTRQVNWGTGGSGEQTSGSTNTFSFDTSVSVSYKVTAAGDLFTGSASGTSTFS